MTQAQTVHWATESRGQEKVLLKSLAAALLIELLLVTAFGWNSHWLAHPTQVNPETQYIEAQIFQMPKEAHLVDSHKAVTQAARPEKTISIRPQQGSASGSKSDSSVEEENQTEAGPALSATHGPVAVYAPPPVIPSYLQDHELKASVIIEFLVSTQGKATPRLVRSSGNEELDAIAVKTVNKWIFRPGEQDGKPIDSKVRLTILFTVQ